MSTVERPRGAPLHGKRVYAYIGQTGGGGLDFVSFATEFSLNLTAQNTTQAVVMGSDAVPDVEIHGLVARVRLNLLLTSTEADFLLALGSVSNNPAIAHQEVDYEAGVQNLLARAGFIQASRLDVMIAPLENSPNFGIDTPDTVDAEGNPVAVVVDLDAFRAKPGYIIELNAAAITSLEISGRVGEYTEARLEVESGRFKINAIEDAAQTTPA
jgi:hypothetical protein